MIIPNHQISYQNVVSKYYNFAPDEIGEAISDFNQILKNNDYNAAGYLFYSMIHEPTDGVMTAEIFLPIEESNFDNKIDEQMYFRSYFCITPMVMTRVKEDFDNQTMQKYIELANYIKQRGLQAKTPLFVEFKTNYSGDTYMEMSIGV